MDIPELQKQLTQWKQKYYKTLTELEQYEQLTPILKRGLSRLALAAQGQNDKLDSQLSSLRKNLRKQDTTQAAITEILEQIERTLVKMENGSGSKSIGEYLAELISNLNLTKSDKKTAKKLTKTFKGASNSEIDTLLPELDSFINSCLHEDNTSDINDTETPLAPTEAASINIGEHEQQPAHMLLLQLLERLSLPPALTKRTTTLRRKIEKGIDDHQLPTIIDDIADIISTLGTQSLAEKKEYESFLKSLTTRLNELDAQIHLGTNEDSKAFQKRSELGQAVENQVKNIKSDIEQANNLEQLKDNVNEKLELLDNHFLSYREADQSQFNESQHQIDLLKQRIKLMEQESIELRQSAMRSRDQALKDPLTGIWNRQALNEALEKEYIRWQRYKKPLSIIIWDIDFFKKINDQYGHAAGDKVLKTIANIFNAQTRDADFIARFGGEEFMGVFPETTIEEALSLANKIREKIANSKFHYEQETVTISASAGLAAFQDEDSIDDVFKRADQALYKAKESGRNRCLTA